MIILVVATAHAEVDSPQEAIIYVVEVTTPDEAHLQALLARDYLVANVAGSVVTLYVNADDYNEVMSLGYPVQLVETQPPRVPEKLDAYTTPDQIGALFANYAAAYPQLCLYQSLGQSVRGVDLWAIKITENPGVEADKPAVKYIATMHGDEPIGTELCLFFIQELLTGYGTDDYITDFLQRTIVWVVPMMNPDGFTRSTRLNANNADLNRSFPIYATDFNGFGFDGEALHDDGRQPEVGHVMRWGAQTHFALAANFHGGALVVNYPYDYEPGIPSRVAAPSPDEELFRHISLAYAINNTPMYTNGLYPQGIVNGSLWYSMTGGMQDWNYRYFGVPEVTIEVSVTKKPSPTTLELLYSNNRNSMFAYAEMAHIGIRGLIRDRNTDAPVWSKIMVADNAQPVFSNPDFGNYHRLMLPGNYNISCQAPGYISYFVDDVAVADGAATRVNIPLSNGDVNNDNQINQGDVQLVVDAALGRAVAHDADVDGRGLSATDIQAVINRTG